MRIRLNNSDKNSVLIGFNADKIIKSEYQSALIVGYTSGSKQRNVIEHEIDNKMDKLLDTITLIIGRYQIVLLLIKRNTVQNIDSILYSIGEIFKKNRGTAFTDGLQFYDFDRISVRINHTLRVFESVKDEGIILKEGMNLIKIDEDCSTMVASATIDTLVHKFFNGEFKFLDKQIDEITEGIRTRDKNPVLNIEPTSIKRFFLELSSLCFHVMYDQGVDVDRILNYEDPYACIFAFDETPKIKMWFLDSCQKLYDEYQRKCSEKKNTIVDDVRAYIDQNIKDKALSVNQIAENMNLSPAYISSCYSAETGKTIIGYIIEKRIEKAKNLLMDTNLTVDEISKEVGYYSERYFYSVFKKNIGMTPSQYRKNQHKI